jgi:hypothetical protein
VVFEVTEPGKRPVTYDSAETLLVVEVTHLVTRLPVSTSLASLFGIG